MFMGGVSPLINRPNIPLDQISCWGEQVHHVGEEEAKNRARANGKGESKLILCYSSGLWQIHLS